MAKKSVKAWAIFLDGRILLTTIQGTRTRTIIQFALTSSEAVWKQFEADGYTCRRVVVGEA